MRTLPGSLPSLGLLLSLLSAGCLFKADLPGDENRPCGPGDTCLAGYVCVDGICEESPIGAACDFTDDQCELGFCWYSVEVAAFCTVACSATTDCPAGYRCSDEDNIESGSWVCLPDALVSGTVGSGSLGASCGGADDCRSGLCNGGICLDTCQNESDCSADPALECRVQAAGGSFEAYCMPPNGATSGQGEPCLDITDCARGICIDDGLGGGACSEPCCSTTECPDNHLCWGAFDGTWQVGSSLARTCLDFGTFDGFAFGETCSADLDCRSGVCLADPDSGIRTCSDTCCGDENCPVGHRCEPLLYDVDEDGEEDTYIAFCVARE